MPTHHAKKNPGDQALQDLRVANTGQKEHGDPPREYTKNVLTAGLVAYPGIERPLFTRGRYQNRHRLLA